MDDSELLDNFARTRSQEVFSTLVARHIDLVYSAARRQLHDASAAEDATQQVFVLLAHKAQKVRGNQLTAWLFATTRYVCANARRKQNRRTIHERKAAEMKPETAASEEPAWQAIAPLLDEAIDSLPQGEKDIVLFRYFEKRSFKEVGERFAISEEAARKRVDRATEKLRAFFARAGVVGMPVAGLDAALMALTVTTAPAALVGAIAAKSVASASAVGIGKWGAFLAATTGKKVAAVAVGAAVLVGGTAAVVVPVLNQSPTVAQQPASPATAPSAPSVLTATTSTGVIVELIGVSNLKDETWWDPSGNLLPKQPFVGPDWMREQAEEIGPNGARNERYEFVVRCKYKDGATSPGIFLQPVFGVQTAQQMWESPTFGTFREPGLARILVGWRPPVPGKMKLTVGVAAGEWETLAESAAPTTESAFTVRADKPNLKMHFAPIALEDKKDNPQWVASTQPGGSTYKEKPYTQVAISFSPDLWSYAVDRPDTRVVAIVDGKEIGSEHRRSGTIGRTTPGREWGEIHAFPYPPERISAIRFQIRKYEPVVFDDVCLNPATVTTPTVEVKPPGTPLAPPPPPRSPRPLRTPRPS